MKQGLRTNGCVMHEEKGLEEVWELGKGMAMLACMSVWEPFGGWRGNTGMLREEVNRQRAWIRNNQAMQDTAEVLPIVRSRQLQAERTAVRDEALAQATRPDALNASRPAPTTSGTRRATATESAAEAGERTVWPRL